MSKLFSRHALAALALAFPAAVPAQPVINAVVNNFSGVVSGLPNYGIAPASLFVIYGNQMCASASLVVQSSAGTGLPQTLNDMVITVTVNGVTTKPGIYYAIPTQVSAVLPSTTPVGTGTITVTYNGQSGSAPLIVKKSAFGILTANSTGNGAITATNLQYQDITPTASAAPGQTIVLWGSGLGADTANNDRTYPMKQDNLNDATVYIGGVKADVLYAGRSVFPGVDQIDVTLPALGASPAFETANLLDRDGPRASSGFQGGCAISVAVVANGTVSNFGTLPINPGGGVCSDPELGITGTSSTSGTVKTGVVELAEITRPTSDSAAFKPRAQASTTSYDAISIFTSKTGESSVGTDLSIGNCIVYLPGVPTGNETVTGLDAGTSIGLSGGGISAQLTESTLGEYFGPLTSALMAGTAYTFTGPGGKSVGSFTVTITFPTQLDWTNENSISTVTESAGQLITWTGGATGTYVAIGGNSSTSPTDGSTPLTVTFACFVPVQDQTFTIPSYVLLSLPTGSGALGLTNDATPVAFTATGISHGAALAGDTTDINVTYK
jgi:uncharacterized protein (TIGR03437 family)